MLKQRFSKIGFILVFASLLAPAAVFGQPDKGILHGPIVITAKTLSADSSSNTASFEGSVVATTDDMTMYSDKMTVYYTKEGDIDKIDAEGNIKLVKGPRTLTSKRATYLAKEGKITFTGEPMAVEGANMITGSKIVYLIDEDRSIVHDSKVYIDQAIER